MYYYDFRLHNLHNYYVVCDYNSRNWAGLHSNMQARPCMQTLSESVTAPTLDLEIALVIDDFAIIIHDLNEQTKQTKVAEETLLHI